MGMTNASRDWWNLIQSVLISEWGFDEDSLTSRTPLFREEVSNWMDWVDLLQEVIDRAGVHWPTGIVVDSLINGEDLSDMLARLYPTGTGMRSKGA